MVKALAIITLLMAVFFGPLVAVVTNMERSSGHGQSVAYSSDCVLSGTNCNFLIR